MFFEMKQTAASQWFRHRSPSRSLWYCDGFMSTGSKWDRSDTSVKRYRYAQLI